MRTRGPVWRHGGRRREIPCLPTQIFVFSLNVWTGNRYQVSSENVCFLWSPGTRRARLSTGLPVMLTLMLLVRLIHTDCPQTLTQTRWNSVCQTQTQTHCLDRLERTNMYADSSSQVQEPDGHKDVQPYVFLFVLMRMPHCSTLYTNTIRPYIHNILCFLFWENSCE